MPSKSTHQVSRRQVSRHQVPRRQFLSRSLVAGTAALALKPLSAAEGGSQSNFRICAFEKFLQDLSYDELADVIAELGFVGIEATVRKNGHVLPERVEEDLPKLVEALKKRDLEVTTMTSDVLNPYDGLNEKVLRTAKALGINSYRMGYYRYDIKKPILPQLDDVSSQVNELAAFNRELGVTALYQNHSGAKYVGSTLWDIFGLIKDIPKEEIGLAFDIRHASVEAGLSWPVLYNLVKSQIGILYVKDFRWEDRKAIHVPLGTGRVDPKFFNQVVADGYDGPISLHVEYLGEEGVQANVDALRRDLKVLSGWLN